MRLFLGSAVFALGSVLLVAPVAAQKAQMKIATPTPAGETNVWMERFKDRVEKRAGERIAIGLFPASQLGSIPATIEGLQLGTIEAFVIPPGFAKGVEPRLQVSDAPGVFEDEKHAHRTLTHPEFRGEFLALAEAKGLKGISVFVPNVSSTVMRARPIRGIDDYRGMKIRVLASDMEVEAMKRLGAAPTPMNLTDVMPALQQGAIDGVKAGLTVFVPFRMWSMAKYLTLTGENAIADVAFVSKSWFDKLAPDLRTVLLEEGERLENEMAKWAVGAHAGMRKAWTENGGEIIELPPAERARYLAMIKTVGDAIAAQRPEIKDVYDRMLAVAAKTR